MASNSSFGGASGKSMYIHKLPYVERKKLCQILDVDDFWEVLGGVYLEFEVDRLYYFRQAVVRNSSPTDEMLRAWGTQNHTVLELFILLSKMHHYQAMTVLKPYVPPEYYCLIDQGEENPMRLLQPESNGDKSKDADCNVHGGKSMLFGAHNLNHDCKIPKTSNIDKDKKIINSPENGEASSSNCDNSDPLKAALKGHIPMISYAELEQSTGGWDSKNILGKGGFGTVYKGLWKYTEVAIKRLEVQQCKEDDKNKFQNQLLTELRSLNTFRHDNILPLYGFSVGGSHDCLVYQYMRNGSLDDKLLCRDRTWPLSWSDRLFIAIGIARGLQFLHTFDKKPLVHGDIKCANILLDPSLIPKIGDFGLAREGPIENYTYIKVTRVHGTKPYLPNEFIRDRKFSTKVDVYSYGIVLFELASGLRAYDDKRKYKFLKDHVENIPNGDIKVLSDPRILPDESITFETLIVLGKQCTFIKPKNRPEMVDILKGLEEIFGNGSGFRRLPFICINSGQSDLPMTRDRQVTASVQPQHPKSPSPILPFPLVSDARQSETSYKDYSSSDFLVSRLSESHILDRESPIQQNSPNASPYDFAPSAPSPVSPVTPSPQNYEDFQLSKSSMIPAISELLLKEN